MAIALAAPAENADTETVEAESTDVPAAPEGDETAEDAPDEGEDTADEPKTIDDTVGEAEKEFARGLEGMFRKYLGGWTLHEVLGIAVWQFVAAFAFILLGLVLKKISDFVMTLKVIPLLKRTPFAFDNLLAEAAYKPMGYLLLLAGVALAVGALNLPTEPDLRAVAYGALKVLLAADLVWFLFRVIDVLVVYLEDVAERTDSRLDDQLIPLVRKALKVTVGVVVGIWIIQLMGYNVSSLLAGLGIGGLAVALALQDTLANFFGSIFIFLDRPFAVGDLVSVDGIEGTVERIGFRSTRIRTFGKTLVAIPNKHVADAKVDNWAKRPVRRVFQTVGVTYQTTAGQMEEALAAIRQILAEDEGVDQEYVVVRFQDFGDSSLNILLYYFTKAVDYAPHLETKERVNLKVMRALESMGLSIAFPTRTLYFEGGVARAMAGRGLPPAPEGE